jgi:predicted nucleotidyltransferase
MTNSDEASRAREQVIARFADACSADARIVAAFVGGSIARGEADRHSDIDLCIVTTDAAAEDVFADREALVARLGTPLFVEEWGNENPGCGGVLRPREPDP